jgi:hypothetical protein
VQRDSVAPLIRDRDKLDIGDVELVAIPGLQRITKSAFTRVFARYGAALRPGNAL